jgi:hypothetical protein
MQPLKKELKLLNCFKNSYNTLKPLLSFLNVNKGINKINKCKELTYIQSTALDWALASLTGFYFFKT